MTNCGKCGKKMTMDDMAVFVNNTPTAFARHRVLQERWGSLCRKCREEEAK